VKTHPGKKLNECKNVGMIFGKYTSLKRHKILTERMKYE